LKTLHTSCFERFFTFLAESAHASSSPNHFSVHSDLTTGIQLVDFIAYIISWNFRVKKLGKPKREELNELMSLIAGLRYRSLRKKDGKQYYIWSFTAV